MWLLFKPVQAIAMQNSLPLSMHERNKLQQQIDTDRAAIDP